MAKYRFTKKAVSDLNEIWSYTIKIWSEKQAEKYYQIIIQACSEIAKDPGKGKEYNEVYRGLKGKKTSKHIIFYREISEKTVEITRILHERMDLKSRLKK